MLEKNQLKKRNHVVPNYLLEKFGIEIKKDKFETYAYNKEGCFDHKSPTRNVVKKLHNVGHVSKENRNEVEDWMCSKEGEQSRQLKSPESLSEDEMRKIIRLQYARSYSTKESIEEGISKTHDIQHVDWTTSIRDLYEAEDGYFSTWSFFYKKFETGNLLISDNGLSLFTILASKSLQYRYIVTFLPISPTEVIFGTNLSGDYFEKHFPLSVTILNTMSLMGCQKFCYSHIPDSNFNPMTTDPVEDSKTHVYEEGEFCFALSNPKVEIKETRIIEVPSGTVLFNACSTNFFVNEDNLALPLSTLSPKVYSVDTRVKEGHDFEIK